MKLITAQIFALASLALCDAFGVQSGEQPVSSSQMSRSNFLAAVGGVAAGAALAPPAWAKESDAALKGTKKDPAFEACLSKCMYECTKPKGVEQKSRAECLPECKATCATSKTQLLKGEPIKTTSQ